MMTDIHLIDTGTRFMGKSVYLESSRNADRDRVMRERWLARMVDYMDEREFFMPPLPEKRTQYPTAPPAPSGD